MGHALWAWEAGAGGDRVLCEVEVGSPLGAAREEGVGASLVDLRAWARFDIFPWRSFPPGSCRDKYRKRLPPFLGCRSLAWSSLLLYSPSRQQLLSEGKPGPCRWGRLRAPVAASPEPLRPPLTPNLEHAPPEPVPCAVGWAWPQPPRWRGALGTLPQGTVPRRKGQVLVPPPVAGAGARGKIFGVIPVISGARRLCSLIRK